MELEAVKRTSSVIYNGLRGIVEGPFTMPSVILNSASYLGSSDEIGELPPVKDIGELAKRQKLDKIDCEVRLTASFFTGNPLIGPLINYRIYDYASQGNTLAQIVGGISLLANSASVIKEIYDGFKGR